MRCECGVPALEDWVVRSEVSIILLRACVRVSDNQALSRLLASLAFCVVPRGQCLIVGDKT